MSAKEEKKKDAFRIIDKTGKNGHLDEEMAKDLREQGDEHSDTIRKKSEDAREIIDSQNFVGRKGRKGGKIR